MGDLDLALEDHEELVRQGALVEQMFAGTQVDLVGPAGDVLEVALRQVREQRDAGQVRRIHGPEHMPDPSGRAPAFARLDDGGVPERPNGTASKAVRGLIRPSRVQITPPPPSMASDDASGAIVVPRVLAVKLG